MSSETAPPACYNPWRDVWVGVTGLVYPCCASLHVLADLSVSDAADIWANAMSGLRLAMEGGGVPEHCRRCYIVAFAKGE